MTDVFISYAHEDRAWVETLAAALESAGLDVWWDGLTPFGQSVTDAVEREIAAAKTVLVVWSKAALAARNVKAEADDARERGILVALRKDDTPPPLGFREIATSDLNGWTGGPHPAIDALAQRLKAKDAPPPPAAAVDDERTVFQPRALQIGDVLAHYRIVGRLGEGGSGAIYEARNIYNEDERVALKIVLPDIGDRDRFFQFLRAEANALQHVKHEAVVQYRTFGRIPNSDECFLVIEYVEGPTLAQAMRRARLAVDDVRKLAVRLAQGLGAAHEQGVIHRDLSPDNVILAGGEPDGATLIDFGIARSETLDLLGVKFAGKLSYAAPEQFAGDAAAVGPWSDLYSLGLVLAAAARGRKLPMGTDLASAIAARHAVPVLDGVPDELHAALAALLQPNPALRVRSAAAAEELFAEPLSKPALVTPAIVTPIEPVRPLVQIRDAEPAAPPIQPIRQLVQIRDVEETSFESEARPPRRWPWLLAAAAIGAVAVYVGAAFLLPRTDDTTVDTADIAAPSDRPPAPSPDPKPEATPEQKRPDIAAPPALPSPLVFPKLPPPDPTIYTLVRRPLDPRLTDIVAAAEAAGVEARFTQIVAMQAALRWDAVADEAQAHADTASAAAEKARAAAKKACGKKPPKGVLCFDSADGSHYAGEVACKADGSCTSFGFGVKSTAQGWAFQGKWGKTSLIVACEVFKGATRYCGDENENGTLDGYGVVTGSDGSLAIGLTDQASATITGRFDFTGVEGSAFNVARGVSRDKTLQGPGIVEARGGIVFYGNWKTGLLQGPTFVRFSSDEGLAALYKDNIPVIGEIAFGDGRRYVGEIGRTTGYNVAPMGLGVTYAADGRIEAQGRWATGALVEDFTGAAPAASGDLAVAAPAAGLVLPAAFPDMTELDRRVVPPRAGE